MKKTEWVIINPDGSTCEVQTSERCTQVHVHIGQVFVTFKSLEACRVWAKGYDATLIERDVDNNSNNNEGEQQ